MLGSMCIMSSKVERPKSQQDVSKNVKQTISHFGSKHTHTQTGHRIEDSELKWQNQLPNADN